MIEVQGVTFKYDKITALNNVSIQIEKGLKYAILGANGAGKTTFLLHLNGILRPLSGKIFYDGTEVTYDHKSLVKLRKRVGVVFQDPEAQLFSATVAEDVSFGPMNLSLSLDEVKQRVDDALHACGIYELKERPTHSLSHGQKKLAAIAGVIAMKPQVIVLDEPLAGLDPRHKDMVLKIFASLNAGGVTLLMSTHNVDLAYEWADRVIVMNDGAIAANGTPFEIFSGNNQYISKPVVLEIYQRLLLCGFLKDDKRIPRLKDELIDDIEGAALNLPQGGAPP
ncbi:MAG: ABC transporter ATP-binding protein [Nitrospirae bacterium]|nr:ABC transporter ATP-binding protein [Nitrospirota bacterium]